MAPGTRSKVAGKRHLLPGRIAAAAIAIAVGCADAAGGGITFSGQVTRDAGAGLSPLSAETVSFTDAAGLRLIVSNPTRHRQKMRLSVYDHRFSRIDAETFPANMMLNAGASSEVTVIVPFFDATVRDLNICVDRINGAGTKRHVCGRYQIRRLSLN